MRFWIFIWFVELVIVYSQQTSTKPRVFQYFVRAHVPNCECSTRATQTYTIPSIVEWTTKPTRTTTERPKIPPKTVKESAKVTKMIFTQATALPSATSTTTLPRVNCEISDILFVLDSTGSVRHFYEQQKRYMASIINAMNIGPHAQHVGLIIYSSKSRKKLVVQMDDEPDKESFLKTIDRLPYFGGITATGAALDLSLQALEKRRLDKRTVVVVLTDGFSFDRVQEPSKQLHALPNVITIAAGVADPYRRDELITIAGSPDRVFIGESEKAKVLNAMRC